MIGSLTSCSDSDKEYPVNNSSYTFTDNEVGCKSKYSSDKKKKVFNTSFKNHWMTWKGEVILPDSDSVALNVDFFGTQDLSVKFKDKDAGYNLQEGQIITVRFLMKSRGGCFLPFSGKQAEILQ